ncbi:MAG TPA: methyltransferase [Thermomicrobiales bacterium]|nr:methyltransferase [Thermomicrobiales bacterium]
MSNADATETAIYDLINSFRISQAVSVAVRLGLADLIRDDVVSIAELATQSGTNPDALYRLLRALAAVGVLHEEADRHFRLDQMGQFLRRDHSRSVAGWAAFISEPSYWAAWGDLLHSVQSGENAYRHVHGVDNWTYRSQHPEAAALFDDGMTAVADMVVGSVLDVFDFGPFPTIADIGGGRGAFLAAILSKHPGSRGILFDLPHVVAGADAVLGKAGVADRCQIIGGTFFDGIPAGADAYIMKSILHDWEDADCLRILRACRAAMPSGSALLLVEWALGPANANQSAKFSDLNMLVSPGGRERTAEAYAALMTECGFAYQSETPSRSGRSVFAGTALPMQE